MKFKKISSNIILCNSRSLITSFTFECAKSFLSNGFHVHFISKTRVEEIPFTIHGGIKPTVDGFSQLTLKYFENVEQVLEYACELQYVKSIQRRYPKVVIMQDYENYLKDEAKGALLTAMLLDALNALSKAFNCPIYFLAGLTSSATTSIRILPSLIDNFFSSVWEIKVESDEKTGSLIKFPDGLHNESKEVKFIIGQNDVLFIENIFEHFEL